MALGERRTKSSEQECVQRQNTGDLWREQIFGLVQPGAPVGEERNASVPRALDVGLRRVNFILQKRWQWCAVLGF